MAGERILLPELRERVRRIERPAATAHGVSPFGIAALDRALPGGGLARGALHEIQGMGGDEEDGALAAAFAAGILGRLTRPPTSPSQSLTRPGRSLSPLKGGEGLVLWCLPRPDLYGPGLAAHGLDPGRVVLVSAPRDGEILWAMEEGLRAPGIAAVVGEVGTLPAVASRRLQLAAERSGITAFLLRRWRDGGQTARERALPNAATTRWRIAALPSHPPFFPSVIRHPRESGDPGASGTSLVALDPRFRGGDGYKASAGGGGLGWGLGIGRSRWRVELLRCRGGEPACWEMEVPDATDHVSLAATLADRPAAPLAAEKFRRTG
jgi:protein ImuA